MNWIERMYEIKGKDLYSQNGEGLLLEYVWHSLKKFCSYPAVLFDIGCGDKFILSNSRHLEKSERFTVLEWDIYNKITVDNCTYCGDYPGIISIDIDGNDYWILDKQLPFYKPAIVCAEFNPAFTDVRTIKYNADHEWAGDDYYGFSFEAGKILAEKHGYEIIFNVANMNLIMVRKDLIGGLTVPPVTYEQENFFKKSERTDWVYVDTI